VAKSEVKGVELETALDWEKWNIALSGTWMDGVNKTPDRVGSVRYDGKMLPNRPEWSGALRITRKFGRGSAFAEYQYVGENYADSSEKILFDARSLFNIGVKYNLSPTTRLTAGANDIFNDADGWRMRPDGMNGPTRMLWYPVEGRSYYLTLDMDL
jgi:outer membrane receptor protein involved in Fe transport